MITIRKEKFGGIIFNNENAIQISLDKEGYLLFKKYFDSQNAKFYEDEKKFLKNTLKILETKKKIEVKTTEIGDFAEKYSFEVLNSPALADIQITAKCNLHCPHCYANSMPDGGNIFWKDLILALDNFSSAGVFQVALGGGEPTLHPNFTQILKEVRKRKMIPNLTTNGKELTEKIAKDMGDYCGAVALSIEGIGKDFEKRRNFSWNKFCQSIKLLKKHGNRLVFQITASDNNIEKLPDIIEFLLESKPYGLIFLAYKPVGRGKFFDDVLASRSNDFVKGVLKKCLIKISDKTKVGFDCCFVQGIIELAKELSPFDFEIIEGCSALRNSLAVNKNLDVLPCSFINYSLGNLKQNDLVSLWQGEKAKKFRKKFYRGIEKKECKNCVFKYQCLGGCPEFKLLKCSKC